MLKFKRFISLLVLILCLSFLGCSLGEAISADASSDTSVEEIITDSYALTGNPVNYMTLSTEENSAWRLKFKEVELIDVPETMPEELYLAELRLGKSLFYVSPSYSMSAVGRQKRAEEIADTIEFFEKIEEYNAVQSISLRNNLEKIYYDDIFKSDFEWGPKEVMDAVKLLPIKNYTLFQQRVFIVFEFDSSVELAEEDIIRYENKWKDEHYDYKVKANNASLSFIFVE